MDGDGQTKTWVFVVWNVTRLHPLTVGEGGGGGEIALLSAAMEQIFVVAEELEVISRYLQPEACLYSNSFLCHYVKYPKQAQK